MAHHRFSQKRMNIFFFAFLLNRAKNKQIRFSIFWRIYSALICLWLYLTFIWGSNLMRHLLCSGFCVASLGLLCRRSRTADVFQSHRPFLNHKMVSLMKHCKTPLHNRGRIIFGPLLPLCLSFYLRVKCNAPPIVQWSFVAHH